jgi:hypothetical protein
MRVILKPAGLILVFCAFVVLVCVVAYDRVSLGSAAHADSDADRVRALLVERLHGGGPPRPEKAAAPVLLVNSGFEENFQPVPPRTAGRGSDTTHRGGSVAAPWRDDSDWADVSVAYVAEEHSVHGGQHCQRVLVQAVRSGAVQMVQQIQPVRGQSYAASCWMKSDQPLEVEIGLRQMGSPFQYYGITKTTVGTEWKKIDVEATVTRRDPALVVVRLLGPANLLIDDAEIKTIDAPKTSPGAGETR